MITRVYVARGEVSIERQGDDDDQAADLQAAHQLVHNVARTMGWAHDTYPAWDPTAGPRVQDRPPNGAPDRPHKRLGLDHRPAGVEVPTP